MGGEGRARVVALQGQVNSEDVVRIPDYDYFLEFLGFTLSSLCESRSKTSPWGDLRCGVPLVTSLPGRKCLGNVPTIFFCSGPSAAAGRQKRICDDLSFAWTPRRPETKRGASG